MKISTKDEWLLEAWFRRQSGALTEIIAEYSQPFYGFLLAASGGTEKLANDLFCRSFVKALRSPSLESRKIPILPELLKYAVTELRAASKPPLPAEGPALARFSYEEDIRIRLLLNLKILSAMSTEDRLVILLRDLAELEISEMAYVLDFSEATLKSRLNQARIQFREKMNASLRTKDFYDLRKR